MDTNRELFIMQQTYATLFSLANKIQVKGDKYLGSLTSRQYMTMIAIAHLSEDETTINNIARKLGTTKQSVKQLITIIEDRGYIITMPSTKDKRAVNVKITEAGRQVMLEVGEKGVFFMEELFKDFTVEELESLWSMLKKLYHFDGEEQDDFEQDSNLKIEESERNIQIRVLKEFERRRIQSGEGNGNYEE